MLTEREKTVIREWNQFAAKMPPSLREMRKALDDFSVKMNVDPPAVGAVHHDVELQPGLRADVIEPKGAGPHPVMLYIHGGGWIMGSSKTHDKLARQCAAEGYLTINLDYRLAPEHPFPAGIDDCVFAVKWIAANAKRYNGDASRLAIGGDSAGGNLTAATLIALSSDASAPKARAGALIYGVFDFPALLERTKNAPALEGMVRLYLGKDYSAVISKVKAAGADYVGVEFIADAATWMKTHNSPPMLEGQAFQFVNSPNRYGLPAFFELHVWAWRDNPNGAFVDWNTRVSCEGQ